MKTILQALLLLVALVASSCRHATSRSMASDWRISEIERAIYTAPEVKANAAIRSIEIITPRKMKVYIGDFGFLSGSGQKIIIELRDDGLWTVESVTFFDS